MAAKMASPLPVCARLPVSSPVPLVLPKDQDPFALFMKLHPRLRNDFLQQHDVHCLQFRAPREVMGDLQRILCREAPTFQVANLKVEEPSARPSA